MNRGALCNVLNCGSDTSIKKCVHEWTGESCPCCGFELIEVVTTGFKFCSNNENICDYEDDSNEC